MLLLHVAFNGEIILSAPSWVSYEPQAIIGRNKVHWIQTTRENNWFPTAAQLEKKIKSIKKKNLILFLILQIILQEQYVKILRNWLLLQKNTIL